MLSGVAKGPTLQVTGPNTTFVHSKERKEALRERKSKVKRNFDLIQVTSRTWDLPAACQNFAVPCTEGEGVGQEA